MGVLLAGVTICCWLIVGILAPKLAAAAYAHRLAMLPVLACLGGVGFAVYTVWQRLLTLGGAGRMLAFWVATLTVVLFITLFAVCVREARRGRWRGAGVAAGSAGSCPWGCARSPWCCPSSMGGGGGSACPASCCWPSPSARVGSGHWG
jgi:hypothetical protein